MSKEYQISSVKDFLTVPPESMDACLADFKEWIALARNGAVFSVDFKDVIGIQGATSFVQDRFTWVDDGVVGISRVDIVGPGDERIARVDLEWSDK